MQVAKSLRSLKDSATCRAGEQVYPGRYALKGTRVYMALMYPNSCCTEIRSRLILRSTSPGANNRLDIESIVSYDRELGSSIALVPAPAPDPEAAPDAAAGASAREHRRGTVSCVLVPWEQVGSSVLNLPASQMDTFITG